jgi:hypothetical protein
MNAKESRRLDASGRPVPALQMGCIDLVAAFRDAQDRAALVASYREWCARVRN